MAQKYLAFQPMEPKLSFCNTYKYKKLEVATVPEDKPNDD